MRRAAAPSARLTLVPLAGVVYFSVCGGTYGVESAVSDGGALAAVALIVALPFLWALPIALIVGELTAVMPREGGYYAWAKSELGDFWACQTGWWALCYSVVDMALYPVLFVKYLAASVPALPLGTPVAAWLAAVAFILAALALNLSGLRPVGRNALIGAVIVMAPLLVCSVIVLAQQGISLPRDDGGASLASLGGALSVVMWNYLGWDNASTYAGEVEKPQHSYPRVLLIVVVLSLLTYLVPLLAGLQLFPDRAAWADGSIWEFLGAVAGGPLLAGIVVAAGAFAQWGLYNSSLLYASRVPFVMARDGWLPAAVGRTSARGMPRTALVVLALSSCVFAVWSFEKLVVIDVLLYSAVIGVELWVFLRMRRHAPHGERSFRIPGGFPVAIALVAAPTLCWCALLWMTFADIADEASSARLQSGVLLAIVAAGVALYLLREHRQSR